jgi:hypothetical protein
VVLYGCESWSLILKEEHKLEVVEKKVLRRIFGEKKVAVTGGWRKLFHNFYSSPNIIKMDKTGRTRWAGHVARMGRRGMNIE